MWGNFKCNAVSVHCCWQALLTRHHLEQVQRKSAKVSAFSLWHKRCCHRRTLRNADMWSLFARCGSWWASIMVTVRKEEGGIAACSKDRWQALPGCLSHVTAVISKLLGSTPQLMILCHHHSCIADIFHQSQGLLQIFEHLCRFLKFYVLQALLWSYIPNCYDEGKSSFGGSHLLPYLHLHLAPT